MRILIADDEPSARKILSRFMEPLGEVTAVEDGKQCLDAYVEGLDQGRPFDVILLDIMMPVMNGQETLKAIRELERERKLPYGDEVKVLMVTCLGDTKNVCEAFFKGQATGYVEKPITLSALYSALESMGIDVNV